MGLSEYNLNLKSGSICICVSVLKKRLSQSADKGGAEGEEDMNMVVREEFSAGEIAENSSTHAPTAGENQPSEPHTDELLGWRKKQWLHDCWGKRGDELGPSEEQLEVHGSRVRTHYTFSGPGAEWKWGKHIGPLTQKLLKLAKGQQWSVGLSAAPAMVQDPGQAQVWQGPRGSKGQHSV